MEKLLRRSILNRNQLVTKKRRESSKELRKAWRDFNRSRNLYNTEMQNLVKQERKARREDWVLGPLAPKRDVGVDKDTFGAVSNIVVRGGGELPRREVVGPRGRGHDAVGSEDRRIPGFEDGEWRGRGLRGNLVPGDRVVVVKGRIGVQGKIGEVSRIDKSLDKVFVKGVNETDMKVPSSALSLSGGAKIVQQELPLSFDDIRLVVPFENSRTGVQEDMIVRQVYGGAPYQQRPNGSRLPRHTRYVQGPPDTTGNQASSDIELPWPADELERSYTQNSDTTRRDVETMTYSPSIDEAVLPSSVIDELRSKHSRHRRDWDDEALMQRKMMEDVRRDWFAMRSQVLSQPFWTKEYLAREKQKMKTTTSMPTSAPITMREEAQSIV